MIRPNEITGSPAKQHASGSTIRNIACVPPFSSRQYNFAGQLVESILDMNL
jgi:hypothetical protein